MRYIVICKDKSAFYTNWWESEDHWNGDTIHCVIDTVRDQVTFDGVNWEEIDEDHL